MKFNQVFVQLHSLGCRAVSYADMRVIACACCIHIPGEAHPEAVKPAKALTPAFVVTFLLEVNAPAMT